MGVSMKMGQCFSLAEFLASRLGVFACCAGVLAATLVAEGCSNSPADTPQETGGAGITTTGGLGGTGGPVGGTGGPVGGTGDPVGGTGDPVGGTGGPVGGTGGSAGGPPGGTGGTAGGTGGNVAGGGGPIAGAGGPIAGAGGPMAGAGGPIAGGGGPIAGAGGMVAGAGGAGGGVPDDRPPCITSPNEVVIIGDSYVVWVSHDLVGDLAALAGENWRLYAQGGASMASGGIATLVPDQFEFAVGDDPNIKAVVMDGGGNDILIVDALMWPAAVGCKDDPGAATNPECQAVIDFAVETARDGMDRMVEVGVKDIIYFFYPYVPEPTVVGGANPNASLEYALPLARETCEGAYERTGHQIRCHFVDMVPVFEGHPEYFAATDIHPSLEGSAAMAQAIWSKMQEVCVGQYESSGCCAP